ncbi:MAG: OmpA family protein [Flavobacteriales bacterium]|nr:OmpA family protein [Flavobacteriales bacterium]
MKKIFLIFIMSLFMLSTQGQSLGGSGFSSFDNRFSVIADDAFRAELYHEAIELYNRAFQKAKGNKIEKQRIYFQIAYCYQKTCKYKEAEIWFDKAIRSGHLDPLAILYLADAKKQNNKFDEALELYEKYAKKIPDDQKGKDGLASVKLAKEWKDAESKYEVNTNNAFNSTADDYSAGYAKKNFKIVSFTSSRSSATGFAIDGRTGQDFSDIFLTSIDRRGKWSSPTTAIGGINTMFNEGGSAFNRKYNKIYFTKCEIRKKENMGCQIYVSTPRGKGYTNGEPIKLAHDSIIVAHPAMAQDNKTLYFASNMRGTLGGTDLWVTTYDKKARLWSHPKNLGPTINTSGNEKFPVIRKNGDLYFASDGHLGMGGLDIFMTKKTSDTTYTEPVNLKYPINTSRDDFGMSFRGNEDKGFITSNRIGGKGGDDIYEFIMPPIEVIVDGYVRNEGTQQVVANAVVELRGSDGSHVIDTTGEDGFYAFPLKNETSYDLEAKKVTFLSGFTQVTTIGIMKSKTITPEFGLELIDTREPINLPNIDFKISDWKLNPNAKKELKNLVKTLNLYPELTIELRSHTDYSGNDIANKELSQKRAQSVLDFLVEEGIVSDRIKAVGYGATVPLKVSKKIAEKTAFHEGDVLTEKFLGPVSRKGNPKWEEGMQLNRRTEFFILSMDYKPSVETVEEEQQEESVD